MTERLYNEESYIRSFRANVVSCKPYKEKMYQVVLDRTAFFPEGGGQTSDTGSIGGTLVVDVRENGEEVLHITENALQVGENIEGVINWEERFDKMQQHTAEHITSGIINAKYGFHNVGFHLNSQIVTMDFDGVITREQGNELEEEVNKAVTLNVPVQVLYPSKEELNQLEYRSKIEIEGQVRIVQVGEYDTCACCAPHVRTTGEIGLVKFTDIQSHRGGVRITMVCGKRALLDYQEKSGSVKGISVLLSAKEKEVKEAVERVNAELLNSKATIGELQSLLVEYKVKAIDTTLSSICLFEDDLDMNHARELVNKVVDKGVEVVAIFLGNDEKGYHYIIGSVTQDVRNLGKELNAMCAGRGGGKPDMIQGSVSAKEADILEVWNQIGKCL